MREKHKEFVVEELVVWWCSSIDWEWEKWESREREIVGSVDIYTISLLKFILTIECHLTRIESEIWDIRYEERDQDKCKKSRYLTDVYRKLPRRTERQEWNARRPSGDRLWGQYGNLKWHRCQLKTIFYWKSRKKPNFIWAFKF